MRGNRGITFAMAILLAVTSVPASASTTEKKYLKNSITIINKEQVKEAKQIGDTIRIKAEVTPATYKDTIKYRSSNKAVAVVSRKGNIRAVGTGTALITVKAANGRFKKRVRVTVVGPN
jgi:hypothetical protein